MQAASLCMAKSVLEDTEGGKLDGDKQSIDILHYSCIEYLWGSMLRRTAGDVEMILTSTSTCSCTPDHFPASVLSISQTHHPLCEDTPHHATNVM